MVPYDVFPRGAEDYLGSPAAYGGKPQIPETTTNVQTQEWTSQLPDYAMLSGQASQLAKSQMAGQVPQDVIRQLQQQAAERGIATGMPGSESANAAYLRALGLTSLGLQQSGIQNYMNLLAQSPKTTTQTDEISNNVLKAIYAAAPSPYAAAMANLQAQQAGLAAGGASGGRVGQPQYPSYSGVGMFQPAAGTYGTVYGGAPTVFSGNAGLPLYGQEPAGTFTTDWASYAPGGFDWYGYDQTPAVAAAPAGTFSSNAASYAPGGFNWYDYSSEGYQPTSSGTMYMGSEEGYYGV